MKDVWRSPLLFGHRGAPATGLPENTLASFRRAIDDGADALETDVHRTKDGHVVVAHDPGSIQASTRAELPPHMPSLAEVLAAFPGVPVNVDIKQRDPPMERDVVAAIGADYQRVLLASFHVDVLARVRAIYGGPTGLSKNEVVRLLLLPKPLVPLFARTVGKRAQVPRRSGRWRFDTTAFVGKCHAIGVAVDYWVINSAEEAKELVDIGADGVMSDAPGVVRGAVRR